MVRYGWYAHGRLHGEPAAGLTFDGLQVGAGRRERLRPELADVGRLARRAVRGVVGAARAGERAGLSDLLLAHLRVDPTGLPVVEETWAEYDHVNVQAGLDAWLAAPGRRSQLVGVVGFRHQPFGLAELLDGSHGDQPWGPRPGNPSRVNLPIGPDGEVRACLRCAVFLVTDATDAGERRTVVLLRSAEQEAGIDRVSVQIASADPGLADVTAAEIRREALAHNVFRGKVVSFGGEVFSPGQTLLRFHRRPVMDPGQLVLPDDVRAAIHRQVVEVGRQGRRLRAAGQHLKRGLLLFGPPGVGKTHTVRYLTGLLEGTTVIQLSGAALHLISEACSVARALQPAMLVVEDVDLIAEDRGLVPGEHPILFQLLNEMDGLSEDADVVFVLTTNRADLLEPALAARPGRVDQAVEMHLPDRASRRQLFELYRGTLDVDTARLDAVLDRTDGVTASFLKELLRRAAVVAAARDLSGGDIAVSAGDLDAALEELLDTRNTMTRVLLGSARRDAVDDRLGGML